MEITYKVDYYTIKILINELPHIYIVKKNFLGYHTWWDNEYQFVIEFVLKGNLLKVEYDNRETWEQVLRLLDAQVQ